MKRLLRITNTNEETASQLPEYALTADNLLKMALITTRIEARIPVVMMGETGCGKTSLIKYLANVSGAEFVCLNFHAGISQDIIGQFVRKVEQLAKKEKKQVWVFLDEINTCNHLPLLSDLICNSLFWGKKVNSKVVWVAACNPYRINVSKQPEIGLKKKVNSANLIYRVLPLPETLLEYVWDYGFLGSKDEREYIRVMTKSMNNHLVVDLLCLSQDFVRTVYGESSVSLRDVKRFIVIYKWFMYGTHWIGPMKENKAIVLSLLISYECRLVDSLDRERYRLQILQVLSQLDILEETYLQIINEEEYQLFSLMEVPPGTAPNASLLENLFVLVICILNKIPVFLVGKPGCSKSLSVQIINRNLCGEDSGKKCFRSLPQIYVLSYQGSESSTSEGILEVFEKAQNLTKDESVIPVVLLDEVGLAETSKHNPLKVLHHLTEPEFPADSLKVAVVGISNWNLDMAKMNRSIQLSRPEPTVDDLIKTGQIIAKGTFNKLTSSDLATIRVIAKAYHDYVTYQERANFHGLRDFYSLIKSVSNMLATDKYSMNAVIVSVQRNFGGLRRSQSDMIKFIQKYSTQDFGYFQHETATTIELIQQNLLDKTSRHLLLFSMENSALSILTSELRTFDDKKAVILYGSKFPDDCCVEYNYRLLSKIILCMESGTRLILIGLEEIYGGLYDMLNQSYTIIGGKRHCRIALGAYSSPMCHVHEDFRCVIIFNQDEIDMADPPFLNRFEKHILTYNSVRSSEDSFLLNQLEEWVSQITTNQNGNPVPVNEVFLGWSPEWLPSLVYDKSLGHAEQRMEHYKSLLVNTMPFHAVIALRNSKLPLLQIDELQDIYLKQQFHGSFHDYFDNNVCLFFALFYLLFILLPLAEFTLLFISLITTFFKPPLSSFCTFPFPFIFLLQSLFFHRGFLLYFAIQK